MNRSGVQVPYPPLGKDEDGRRKDELILNNSRVVACNHAAFFPQSATGSASAWGRLGINSQFIERAAFRRKSQNPHGRSPWHTCDPRLQRGDRLSHRLRNYPTNFVFREPSCHATFITDSTHWRNTIFWLFRLQVQDARNTACRLLATWHSSAILCPIASEARFRSRFKAINAGGKLRFAATVRLSLAEGLAAGTTQGFLRELRRAAAGDGSLIFTSPVSPLS